MKLNAGTIIALAGLILTVITGAIAYGRLQQKVDDLSHYLDYQFGEHRK